MTILHAQIINLPCKPYDGTDAYTHYCLGHRDARHAAAELAIAVEQQRDELLAALERIAKIKHKMSGGDWDEIEEAQSIARLALIKHAEVA